LGNKQPVKGVTMVKWQRPDAVGVAGGDRQQVHPRSLQPFEQVAGGVELAEAALDRDLPDHDGADYDRLASAADRFSRPFPDPIGFTGQPPENDMGVE
jgi:hypothetical protein